MNHARLGGVWIDVRTNVRVLAAALALTAIGCAADTADTKSSAPATAASTAASPDSDAGCGSTEVTSGQQTPPWAEVGASFLRFVTADEGNAVGFLFADPLRAAPRDDGKNNKVLWVVREPRNGSNLTLEGTLNGKVVTSTESANSSPGEIYPSIVDAPTPGCWHFTLRWGDNVAHLDLEFAA